MKLEADPPLSGYECFRASSGDELAEKVNSKLGGRLLVAPRDRSISSVANCCKMASSELWFCSYGAAVTIGFAASDYFRIQLRHTGAGATTVRREATAVTAAQGCISSAEAVVEFGADFQQLAWRISRDVLIKKLVALTGKPIVRGLEFNSTLQTTKPQSEDFLRIMDCLVTTVGRSASPAPRLLLAELEQALIVSFLYSSEHGLNEFLEGVPLAPAPWQVRRAEEFIDENWDKPFTIEGLVAETGASARSIYRAFRQSRGCTPHEFAKWRRLLRARDMLKDMHSPKTVTEVAYASGYNDLSHFSKDFAKAFGEPPSAVLKTKQ